MLKLEHISKSFNNNIVLKDVNLELNEGEIYGLIGKNGAGKTTIMNIISKILSPDSGEIYLDGKRVESQNDLSGKLCYIVDVPAGYLYLSAYEYLSFLASPLRLSKEDEKKLINEKLALVNLPDTGKKLIKTFSRGMKQRLGIAAGLVFNPKIIIMDEPTSALDPEGRLEVLNIIENLKKEGKTILLSTHILSDVERVCDRIGLLSDGVIKIDGKTKSVIKKYLLNTVVIDCPVEDQEIIKKAFEGKDYVSEIRNTKAGLEIDYKGESRQDIFIVASNASKNIVDIHVKHKSIEEIFIEESKEVK